MPLQPHEIKKLVKERGWTFADLAARWGHSVFYMSRLVNEPHKRPPAYEDAFRGLPPRDSTVVKREPRHTRKPAASRLWSTRAMFPKGRVFQALDSTCQIDEGTRLSVTSVEEDAGGLTIHFEVLDSGEPLSLPYKKVLDHFQDIDVQR